MSSALLRLRESSERFSSTERGVAERILSNPQMVVDLSIHELAQKTFSSRCADVQPHRLFRV